MKPAFDAELTLSGDHTTVHVSGPYELEGDETDAYFWFRISQPPLGEEGDEVEAIGIHDREQEQMEKELAAARKGIRDAVADAVAGALGATGAAVTAQSSNAAADAARDAAIEALATKGPKWKKSAKARESKAFRPGAARAEGWLLMKTTGDPVGSSLFWTSEVTLSAPAAKPRMRT
jgi:hypothetical protein